MSKETTRTTRKITIYYLLTFIILISCLSSNVSSVKLDMYFTPPAPNSIPASTTQTASLSAATSDKVATIVDARASAQTGNIAVGIAGAQANNDYISNTGGVVAVADAQNNEKSVDSHAHQQNLAMRREYTDRDAQVQHTASTSYTTGVTKRTDADDNVTTYATGQFEIDHNKLLTNSRQTVQDNSLQATTFQAQTDQPNVITQTVSKDIKITIDSKYEKLIIEKLIHRDDRVIIVTAAKYLKKTLISAEINYIQDLIYGQCNCKKIKDYVIELLAEAN